ncbi:hypothetical protein [Bacillus sp. FJAT-29814]|uniref:DarT1-associated NADAR antitoxin family protein n=1 Tax=Bacillus sp. FJAT-29814 TaxID=1729688 RepID=UPI00082B1679|nr:hypothetical protein [Bacillus sp. FJAT-29814]
MAIRPVFCVSNEKLVKIEVTKFTWFPGFAPSQKVKSIQSLHDSFLEKNPGLKVLEISSKSTEKLGVQLSAFNLEVNFLNTNQTYLLECVFQGSKVFENGGPFIDLLNRLPIDAKRDTRLKTSEKITHFNLLGEIWPNNPPTLFYDWLYIKSVYDNKDLLSQLVDFDAFTDIEFNPKKSINCQAKSAALLVSLYRQGILEDVINNRENFIKLCEENFSLYN